MTDSLDTAENRGRGMSGCCAIGPRYYSFLAMLAPVFAFWLATFAPALPGYEFQFPRDHGSHDEYKTEWWYYTGNLRTDRGHRYGFEVTFFRVGIVPPDGTAP